MIVRELITKLGFKTDTGALNKFESGVKSAKVSVIALTAAITAAATAVFLFVESAAKAGDRLDKLRDMIGMTTKDYQLLEGAANLAGIENEAFSKSLQLFSRSIGMARQGMSQYIKEFAILGINMRTGNGQLKSQKELLFEVADAFKNKLKNNVDRAAVSQLLFGRSGLKMINFLKEGRGGIEKAIKLFGKYAFILDKKAIKKSQEFRDSQFLLTAAFKGLKNEIGIGLMPVVQKMINETLKWLAANRKLIVSGLIKFFKIMIVLAKGLGKTMGFLISVVKDVVNIWKDLNNAFGVTVKIVTGLFAAGILLRIIKLKDLILSFFTILNVVAPEVWAIGAAIGALVLVLDDIAVYMTGGKSLTGELLKKFPALITFFKVMMFNIRFAVTTIRITLKVIMALLIGFKMAINFAIISPLKFVISLVKDIFKAFMALFGIPSKVLGMIGHGLSAIGITHHMDHATGNNLDFTKRPSMGVPSLIGAGGTKHRHINVNTAINLTVPPGTPESQQDFLQRAATDSFEPIFGRKLKEALSVFPAVEQ